MSNAQLVSSQRACPCLTKNLSGLVHVEASIVADLLASAGIVSVIPSRANGNGKLIDDAIHAQESVSSLGEGSRNARVPLPTLP
jgi:hypothetical protein